MPSKTKPKPKRPSEVFAHRMKEVRERKRWSQQDLADRLAEMGEPTDRATIARTETRARGLSLDDAVAYASALGPSLLHMMCPLDRSELVAIGSDFTVPAGAMRRWVRGEQALRDEDARTLITESPDEEWVARQHVFIAGLRAQVRDLIEAWELDDKQQGADLIDQIQVTLSVLKKEAIERGPSSKA